MPVLFQQACQQDTEERQLELQQKISGREKGKHKEGEIACAIFDSAKDARGVLEFIPQKLLS